MAGSYSHIEHGWSLVENMGDAAETAEELLWLVWHFAAQVALTQPIDDGDPHVFCDQVRAQGKVLIPCLRGLGHNGFHLEPLDDESVPAVPVALANDRVRLVDALVRNALDVGYYPMARRELSPDQWFRDVQARMDR